MESNVPYQKLKKDKRSRWSIFSICFGNKINDKVDVLSRDDMIEMLRKKRHEISAKAANINYQMVKLQSEAYQLYKEGDKAFARSKLVIKKRKLSSRNKLLNILENLEMIEQTLIDAITNESIFENIKQSKITLENLTSNVSIDQVDEMMIDFENINEKVNNINGSLGTLINDDEFDVNDEMQALEIEVGFKLPNVPSKNNDIFIPQKKIKIIEN